MQRLFLTSLRPQRPLPASIVARSLLHSSATRPATPLATGRQVQSTAPEYEGQGYRENHSGGYGISGSDKRTGGIDHVYTPMQVQNPDYSKGPSALDKAAHLFFFTEIMRGKLTLLVCLRLANV